MMNKRSPFFFVLAMITVCGFTTYHRSVNEVKYFQEMRSEHSRLDPVDCFSLVMVQVTLKYGNGQRRYHVEDSDSFVQKQLALGSGFKQSPSNASIGAYVNGKHPTSDCVKFVEKL
eukprot:Gb_34827 [translate_table: standard]